MKSRPPKIEVEKPSSAKPNTGDAGIYRGGLSRTEGLGDERLKQEQQSIEDPLRLDAGFPYAVIPFDPDFFGLPAKNADVRSES